MVGFLVSHINELVVEPVVRLLENFKFVKTLVLIQAVDLLQVQKLAVSDHLGHDLDFFVRFALV